MHFIKNQSETFKWSNFVQEHHCHLLKLEAFSFMIIQNDPIQLGYNVCQSDTLLPFSEV